MVILKKGGRPFSLSGQQYDRGDCMPSDEGILASTRTAESTNLLYAYILAGIGFGCMIGWDIIGLFAPALPLLSFGGVSHALLLCTVGIASTAISYVVGHRFADKIFRHRAVLAPVAGACGIVVALLGFAHQVWSIPTAFDIVGWIAFGFGKALLCLVWCAYLSAIPTKCTGIAVGCGAVFGSALFGAIGTAAPDNMFLLGAIALPIASLAVLSLLFRTMPAGFYPAPTEDYRKPPSALAAPAALSLGAHGIVYGFITFFVCSLDAKAAAIVGASGIVGCALVAILAYFAPKANFDNSIVQRISLPVIVIGLLLIPLLNQEGKIACCCLINSALAFTNVMAWSTVCTENSEFHLQPIARFASRQGPLWAGLLAGAVLTLTLQPVLLTNTTTLSFVVLVLAGFVVISFSIYGADDSKSRHQLEELITIDDPEPESLATDEADQGHEESFKERCDKACDRYGLSPRERDVFFLLAKGRNAKFIQEELCISASTVKTHIYRIYRKMGINSQQLLIDTVDEERSEQ